MLTRYFLFFLISALLAFIPQLSMAQSDEEKVYKGIAQVAFDRYELGRAELFPEHASQTRPDLIQYLKGRILFSERKYKRSFLFFNPLFSEYPAVDDVLKRAKIQMSLKLREDETALLDALSVKNTIVREQLFNQIFQKLNERKNPLISLKTLSVFDEYPDFRNNYFFLRVYLKKSEKNPDIYHRFLKRLWLKGSFAKQINVKLAVYKKSLEKIQKNANLEEWNEHYETQFQLKDYKYMINTLPKVIDKFKKQGKYPITLTHLLIKAYVKSRLYKAALRVLENPKEQLFFQYEGKAARKQKLQIYLLTKNFTKAKQYLGALKKNKVSESTLSLLQYDMASHFFRFRQDYKKSAEAYQKIDENFLSPRQKERKRWEQFFSYLQTKKRKGAATLLEWSKTHTFISNDYGSRFCYWGLKEFYKTLPVKNPCFPKYLNNYYGVSSRKFYPKIKYNPLYKSSFEVNEAYNTLPTEKKEILEWLIFFYAIEDVKAGDYLTKILLENEAKRSDQNFLILVFRVLEKYERYYLQMRILQKKLPDIWQKKNLDNPEFFRHLYPLSYEKYVKKYGEKFKLPNYIIYSIMRQESLFHPTILSPVGAIGLMQIMPKTGKEIAGKQKIRFSRGILSNPNINVQFGSYYFQQLKKQFKHSFPKALASYNGGANNVKRWIRKHKPQDDDYFVENIGFNETAGYVKSVIRNYHWYKMLYEEQ